MIALLIGAVSLIIGLVGPMPDWSPYRFGRAGGAWLSSQLSAGILLLFCGAFGILFSRVDSESAQTHNMPVFWIMLSVNVTMSMFSVWIAIYSPASKIPIQLLDEMARAVAVLTNIFALMAFGLCVYYGIWVHRMRKTSERHG